MSDAPSAAGTPGRPAPRPLDRFFDGVPPQKFRDELAMAFAQAWHRRDVAVSDDPFGTGDWWGVRSADLDLFAALRVDGGMMQACPPGRDRSGNAWVELIGYPSGNVHEELAATFMGAVQICLFGDCNSGYLTLFRTPPDRDGRAERPQIVYEWDHELYYIGEVVALCFPDFLYQVALVAAHEVGLVRDEVAQQAWQRLSGRVSPHWALSSGRPEDGHTTVDLDPDWTARALFWRAQWIVVLLSHDTERDWDDVYESFRPELNPALDDDRFEVGLERGRQLAPEALYLLWRSFWFDHAGRLRQCQDAYRDHPARIVRDLVELLTQVVGGNDALPGVASLLAVRKRFLGLALDPDAAPGATVAEDVAAVGRQREDRATAAEAVIARIEAGAALDDEDLVAACQADLASENGRAGHWLAAVRLLGGSSDAQAPALLGAFLDARLAALDTGSGLGAEPGKEPGASSEELLVELVQALHRVSPRDGDEAQRLAERLFRLIDLDGWNPDEVAAAHPAADGWSDAAAMTEFLLKTIDLGGREADDLDVADLDVHLAQLFGLEGRDPAELEAAPVPSGDGRGAPGRVTERLLRHLLLSHRRAGAVSGACVTALSERGYTGLLGPVSRLINHSGEASLEAAGLLSVARIAAGLPGEDRAAFVSRALSNPRPDDPWVTICYDLACRALLAADARLPLAPPDLDPEQIRPYLDSPDRQVRAAAAAALAARWPA